MADFTNVDPGEENAPAQNPQQNFGDKKNPKLQPPDQSEMLSQSKIDPKTAGQPTTPQKPTKINDGEEIPDPLNMSHLRRPMSVIPADEDSRASNAKSDKKSMRQRLKSPYFWLGWLLVLGALFLMVQIALSVLALSGR